MAQILKEWKCQRLDQDDPRSPFLFSIVVDALSRMMITALERIVLEGFSVGRD